MDASTPGPQAANDAATERVQPSAPLATDFVDMRSLLPALALDMRYAGTNNFVGKAIYPSARCLLRRPVALALVRVQARLAESDRQLLVWDCYRPFSVQEVFWELVPDPRYVARPIRKGGRPFRGSKHNRGAAIDLSLADQKGVALPMPTDHDDFSPRAHRNAKDVPAKARANARALQEAMEAEGFSGIATEWWHFDHHSAHSFPLSDQPLEGAP